MLEFRRAGSRRSRPGVGQKSPEREPLPGDPGSGGNSPSTSPIASAGRLSLRPAADRPRVAQPRWAPVARIRWLSAAIRSSVRPSLRHRRSCPPRVTPVGEQSGNGVGGLRHPRKMAAMIPPPPSRCRRWETLAGTGPQPPDEGDDGGGPAGAGQQAADQPGGERSGAGVGVRHSAR